MTEDPTPESTPQFSPFAEEIAHLEAVVNAGEQTAPLSSYLLYLVNDQPDRASKAQGGQELSESHREVMLESTARGLHKTLSEPARQAFIKDIVRVLAIPADQPTPKYAEWLKSMSAPQKALLTEALQAQFPELQDLGDPNDTTVREITNAPPALDETDLKFADLLARKLPLAPVGAENTEDKDVTTETNSGSEELELSDEEVTELRRRWISNFANMTAERLRRKMIIENRLPEDAKIPAEELEQFRIDLIREYASMDLDEFRLREEFFRNNQEPTGDDKHTDTQSSAPEEPIATSSQSLVHQMDMRLIRDKFVRGQMTDTYKGKHLYDLSPTEKEEYLGYAKQEAENELDERARKAEEYLIDNSPEGLGVLHQARFEASGQWNNDGRKKTVAPFGRAKRLIEEANLAPDVEQLVRIAMDPVYVQHAIEIVDGSWVNRLTPEMSKNKRIREWGEPPIQKGQRTLANFASDPNAFVLMRYTLGPAILDRAKAYSGLKSLPQDVALRALVST